MAYSALLGRDIGPAADPNAPKKLKGQSGTVMNTSGSNGSQGGWQPTYSGPKTDPQVSSNQDRLKRIKEQITTAQRGGARDVNGRQIADVPQYVQNLTNQANELEAQNKNLDPFHSQLTPDQQKAYIAEQQARETQMHDFDTQMPEMKTHLFDTLTQNSMQQTQQNTDALKQHDSNRGLLYSGMHAQNEALMKRQAADQLAESKSRINQETSDLRQKLNLGQIQSGLDLQKILQGFMTAQYNIQLGKEQQSAAEFGGILGAVGTLGGLAATAATGGAAAPTLLA